MVAFWAAAGAQNVLVVANQTSAASLRIAEYYARRRGIPASNVCRLRTTASEEIARDVYDREIAAPIGEFLKARKLAGQVLYIVTTLGVPLKIRGSGGMEGDAASVDSELTLLYQDLAGKRHELRGPVANPFHRKRGVPFTHPLFPMYLVTRLAGYDVGTAMALVDRSLKAANRGRFVLDLSSSGDGGGNEWLRNAAILLPARRVVIEESQAVLYGQRGVIGYGSWGSNDGNRKRRFLGFEWLPGAIVTEYVSTNGRTFERPPRDWIFTSWEDRKNFFAGSPQSLAADYLEEGAAGVSGHVYEPFLGLTPRPDYLFPAYYSGRNLAESYYLAIPALSWQNVVVGDPLCSLGPPEFRGQPPTGPRPATRQGKADVRGGAAQ